MLYKYKYYYKYNMTKYTVLGTNKKDGFGAQYIANICCYIKCRNEGKLYKHIPYTSIDHNYDNNSNYPIQLNEFSGLKSDDLSNINDVDIEEIISGWQYPLTYNDNTDKYINEIREMYYSTCKPEPISCDVAIHIRRGDVSKSRNQQRFIELEYYSNIVEKLIHEHGENIKIIVFSQGKLDFQELSMYNHNITFMLNTNLLESFHSMVKAPIFVMGYSALSCCIALLSNNTVYYTHSNTWSKQCIPKKKEWIYIK